MRHCWLLYCLQIICCRFAPNSVRFGSVCVCGFGSVVATHCWSKLLLRVLFMDFLFFFFSLCLLRLLPAHHSLTHSLILVSSLTNFIVIQHMQLFICSQNIFFSSSSSSPSFIVLFVFDLNLSLGQPTDRLSACLYIRQPHIY